MDNNEPPTELIEAARAWDSLTAMREMMRMMQAQLTDLHEFVNQHEEGMRALIARARVGDDEQAK